MITNIGRSGLALAFCGSMTIPTMMDIGTGSAAMSVTRSGLVTPAATAFYTTRDMSTSTEANWTYDFSSVTMSGLAFKEFGLRTSGGGLGSGNFFNVDNVTSLTYDGTNELQIQLTYKIY
jgi:hypothetical protein